MNAQQRQRPRRFTLGNNQASYWINFSVLLIKLPNILSAAFYLRFKPMKNGALSFLLRALVPGLLLTTGVAWAQAPEPARPPENCVEVEVNGQRVPSYECLQQRLSPEKAKRPPTLPQSEQQVLQAPNSLGLPTPSTLSNRMGNQFGQSAFPQRPPAPAPR